jgi:DNA-binding NarL/FixJ family response regulator
VPKCILIVDDNEAIRTATRHFLESQPGFEVCGEAVDGIDALEKARHFSPDLIILDLEMPRMNGLQAARELRAMRVRAPIILFTIYADAVPPQDALAAGVDAVVSKTNSFALRQHIESLLQSV